MSCSCKLSWQTTRGLGKNKCASWISFMSTSSSKEAPTEAHMIPFRKVTHFQEHHSLPYPVTAIHVTTVTRRRRTKPLSTSSCTTTRTTSRKFGLLLNSFLPPCLHTSHRVFKAWQGTRATHVTMSQTLERRDAPPFVNFLKNFDLLSSIAKFLVRHAQNHDGNMASLLKVNKSTWGARQDLYKTPCTHF